MNPEEIISGFLSVWENNSELFNNPDVLESLEDLQNQLAELETESDEKIADCLEDWFSDYEAITDAVDASSTRKLRGANNAGPKTDDRAVVNQYPEITEILRNRVPRMGTKEGKS